MINILVDDLLVIEENKSKYKTEVENKYERNEDADKWTIISEWTNKRVNEWANENTE